MTRGNAALRLHTTLQSRIDEGHKKLAVELANLHDCRVADSVCDSAEVSSQLAELDASELGQIERAAARLQRGLYGICEGGSPNCQSMIPPARLKVLPYTTLCIN